MKKSEKPPKKTLAEVCQNRLHTIHDAKREKEKAAKQVLQRAQEDEVMAATYGPNWRDYSEPKQTPEDDEDITPPDAGESSVRLRAS